MFDTIDFGIENISIKELQYDIVFNNNTKTIKDIILFQYQNILFYYHLSSHFLSIHTNAHQLLNKTIITLKDKLQYINTLNSILSAVIIHLEKHKIKLMRVDYHIDLKLDDKVNDYIQLLNNNVDVYKYMKKRVTYYTSLHLTTKNGKQNINIYNKGEEAKDKAYEGILRVEIQCKKILIKGEFKKYGITRELDNYWNANAMEDYFFSIVDGFCYKGDYYKREIANTIIDNSNNTLSMKNKLKEFLFEVEKKGLEKVKKSKKYNSCSINTRIKKLTVLNINPIPIPSNFNYDKLENLPSLARKVAKEKYFVENKEVLLDG